ncbi:Nif3-like dinuclear metal center hexameric protein [Mucispirillum schaedleri]|uniref:GTP cyclohydrolase 1 type 2 homolog n=1 Tax=Mucispirillum schaedleri ASF457 TaxID=1379858 RepID=V2QB32_9BACT|nr:Nif3-like dinuclear metal center hexameric protein [Mucispirillum schaedleri]MCX4359866.1 Nif3-like dinuclear metal center hexameric protein [Mucispirillum schaedleri]USF23412.1 GTP cyclohydrolase 1 type 2 [Mucispirillum schaedleri ASF457]SIW05273.1 putative GTP cyclohydrolase 1 type 2 [Mucispirillum schaedleri ASF457]
MVKISDIINYLEYSFTDISAQSKWDFSGKQIYTGDREISKIALSLDAKEDIIEKAVKEGCGLLITHHPIFFRESKGININKAVDRKVIKAIKGGLDILSYHTNLDMAYNGLNDYICELLNAKMDNGFLSYEGSHSLYKVAVFVPYDYKDEVFNAMTANGAGSIYGNYSSCGFIAEGAGLFIPDDKAKPFIGSANELQIVDEVKIETVVLKKHLHKVIHAMLEAHPYEEAAYDIIELHNKLDYGFGKTASLNKEYSLQEFIKLIQEKLNIKHITTNMHDIKPFSRFGVCTGSGASLWKDALNKGVNVLLTGDLKYHDALDAYEAGVCIIDATHQATEEIYMHRLSEIIKKQFNIEVVVLKQEKQLICWGGNN